MSRIVVLGLDGSEDSVRAIPCAVERAGTNGRIVVVHRQLLIGRAGGMPLVINQDEVEPDTARSRAGSSAA